MLEIPGETVQLREILLRERYAELIKARLLGKLMKVLHAKEKKKTPKHKEAQSLPPFPHFSQWTF